MTRLAAAALCLTAPLCRADLAGYLKKPDKSFAWKLVKKEEIEGGTVWKLSLTSQTWQGIDWTHDVAVVLPDKVKPTPTVFLWNTGGKLGAGGVKHALGMATRMKAPVAFVWGVPNQPLLGDRVEDALVAETFVRYLKTKDAEWPLLFPMAKSVTRAMDAVQAFAKKEWKHEVKDFVVAGASKRGWTSWLVAAADPRVKAVVPVVIDTLNMKKQLPYQKESYGDYSAWIKDYVDRGLVPLPDTDEARKLWGMVDPWLYRAKYKMPKLLIHGTNDPYWTQDALNLYWDDLPGAKWVAYVPNAGHDLNQARFDGDKKGNTDRFSAVLGAFAYCMIHGKEMPAMSWKITDTDRGARFEVTAKERMGMRVWLADSDTRDFRKSRWRESPGAPRRDKFDMVMAPPKKGFRAFLAECRFKVDEISFHLTTQLHIMKAR